MKITPLGASSGISTSVLQLIHCCFLIINYIDNDLSLCFRVHLIDNTFLKLQTHYTECFMTAYCLDSIVIGTIIQKALTKLCLILFVIRAAKSGSLIEAKLP